MRNGVWVHASSDLDIEWFSPYLGCNWPDRHFGTYNGDTYFLGVFNDINHVGRWCDNSASVDDLPFICEANIY